MSAERCRVVVMGAGAADPPPGLVESAADVDLVFAPDAAALRRLLPGAEVLLAWDNGNAWLPELWALATRLRWVHGVGAGIDRLLFPALVASLVTLTSSRGVFDATMAEYALALMLYFAKDLDTTIDLQRGHAWRYRPLRRLAGCTVVVIGAGPIGRAIGRLAGGVGMSPTLVGRVDRPDAEFGRIHAAADLVGLLPAADFVVVAVPLTPATRGLVGAAQLAALRPAAVFISIGRGPVVDEPALVDALRAGRLRGAGLDVFATEPLPPDSPLWDMRNVLVSSHVAGDYVGFEADLVRLFAENLARYRSGRPLRNVVDKDLGYVMAADSDGD